MPRPSKDKLVPYVDDRPDLDQRFSPLDAPTSIDFGRKPGNPFRTFVREVRFSDAGGYLGAVSSAGQSVRASSPGSS